MRCLPYHNNLSLQQISKRLFLYCLRLLMPGKRQRKVFMRTLANLMIPVCRPMFFFVGARLAHPSQGQVTGTPSKKWSWSFQPGNSTSIQRLVCFHPSSLGTRILWGRPCDLHRKMCEAFSDLHLVCMGIRTLVLDAQLKAWVVA